ncbi:unnamed protein product [Parnassius apollo]|uniref:(apollo) hypothetical protein n=1 Tax=Parnassius apollo TaxID=110799 RepID=A0A8S3XQZ4_PARAO|nr:unnamed protein product [Parnassius apollo]
MDAMVKWLSCNGEVWGMGPTAVFASAAALFLYSELRATISTAGDRAQLSLLEKILVAELQARAARGVNKTIEKVQTFVASVQQRLRGYEAHPPSNDIVAPT